MYRSKEVLNTFAEIAADAYLKHQTALNESLVKVANQEALNPHQIEYVAAEANKSVWASLFGMDKKASYDFPLADSAKILGELKTTYKAPAVNTDELDYLGPPTTKTASENVLERMGYIATVDRDPALRRELKAELQNRLEKVAQAKERLRDQYTLADMKAQELEVQFIKTARSLILEVPFEERKDGIKKIGEFLSNCGKPEYSKQLIHKFAYVLKRQGLVKEADLKAPAEYISDKLPGQVINGRHALYITVKTLFDHYDYKKDLENRHKIVDDSLPVIKEKIREL